MSRTNHYRICKECTVEAKCWLHETFSRQSHKPARPIEGRRAWKRRDRWPDYSINAWHSAPPRWWWQDRHARARRVLDQMMRRSDDPALPTEKQLIDLWTWY